MKLESYRLEFLLQKPTISAPKNPLPSSFFILHLMISEFKTKKILKDSKKYIKPTILPSFFFFKTQIKDSKNAQRLKKRGFVVRSSWLEAAAWVQFESWGCLPTFSPNRGLLRLGLVQIIACVQFELWGCFVVASSGASFSFLLLYFVVYQCFCFCCLLWVAIVVVACSRLLGCLVQVLRPLGNSSFKDSSPSASTWNSSL